jgi:hypothetical protein
MTENDKKAQIISKSHRYHCLRQLLIAGEQSEDIETDF